MSTSVFHCCSRKRSESCIMFMIRWGYRTCFRSGSPFFWWSLVRFNCAPNSGVEHVSRPEGCDLKAEGLWALSRILHKLWMHPRLIFYHYSDRLTVLPDLLFLAMFPGRWPRRLPRLPLFGGAVTRIGGIVLVVRLVGN